MDRAIGEPEDEADDLAPADEGAEVGELDGEEVTEELDEGAEAGEFGRRRAGLRRGRRSRGRGRRGGGARPTGRTRR